MNYNFDKIIQRHKKYQNIDQVFFPILNQQNSRKLLVRYAIKRDPRFDHEKLP